MFSIKIIDLPNDIVLTLQRNLTCVFFFLVCVCVCVFLHGIKYFERRNCKIALVRLCFGVRLAICNSRMQFIFLEYVMPSHVQLGPFFFFSYLASQNKWFTCLCIYMSSQDRLYMLSLQVILGQITCHLMIDYTCHFIYMSFDDRSYDILFTCHPKINYTYVIAYMSLLACLLTIDHMSFIHMSSQDRLYICCCLHVIACMSRISFQYRLCMSFIYSHVAL